MSAPPLRVLIVSPDALYRDCLGASLPAEPDLAVHAAVASPAQALQAVLCHSPEVLVVDAASPGRATTELIQRAGRLLPRLRVVLVGLPEEDRHLLSSIAAGTDAYLPRSAGLPALQSTLRRLARMEDGSPPPLAGRPSRRQEAPREAALTPREEEILALIAQGLANKEIAQRLYVSLGTVKNHVHNILDKLGVSGRYAAVANLRGRGWQETDSDR